MLKLTKPGLEDLYNAIGQQEGLSRMFMRFYAKMRDDVLLGFFFVGHDLAHLTKMQTEFVLKAWGISDEYAGRTPREAHRTMAPVLEGHFNRRLVLLAETLREFGLTPEQVERWVQFESNFRGSVQRPND